MNRRDYWHGRYLQIRAANELSTIRFEQEMVTTVDALNTKINQELVSWYKRYARTAKVDFGTSAEILKKARTDGWHQTIDEFQRLAVQGGHTDELDMEYIRSQTARLEQLQIQLISVIAPIIPELTNSMSDELIEQYRYQYEHAMYLNEMASGNTGNFATFDNESLKLVVAQPWAGDDFSHRIWRNFQQDLPNMLMKTLSESVVLGRSPKRLAHELSMTHKQFTEANLHRLINTEMAHIDESANYQALVDVDAEWYEHLATLESHTCEICAKLDGKHFKMSERADGVNYAPIHPHCRCDEVYWEPNMPAVGKRWSRNPVTGKRQMVPGITFTEWRKQYAA